MKNTSVGPSHQSILCRSPNIGGRYFLCATGDETYFVCKRDAAREIEIRKRKIQALSRLANRKVVIRDGRVITAYSSNHADQKRILRRDWQKGLGK